MKKILIVEDHEDIAELIRDVLVKEGYQTLICGDGYQGVEFARKEQPDLIILDLMMPAGGGLFVLEKIKMSAYTKSIPVIVLTASKEPEMRAKAMEMGIDAFLEKPYDPQKLLVAVKGFLGNDTP